MTALVIFGVVLLVSVAALLLTWSSSRTRTRPRDPTASESIAVWTSSSQPDDDKHRDR